MLYQSLESLPLVRFIDMYNGNLLSIIMSGRHDEKELKETSEKLIIEYLEIVGGKSVRSDLERKDQLSTYQATVEVLNACNNLIKTGDYVEVCEILAELGYKLDPKNHDQIKGRIASSLAKCNYRIDSIKAGLNTASNNKVDKDYFYQEITMVMTHFKMHVDKNSISAKEYAYMVKRMCEDIDRMKMFSMRSGIKK